MLTRHLINNLGDFSLCYIFLFFLAAIGLVYGIDFVYKRLKK